MLRTEVNDTLIRAAESVCIYSKIEFVFEYHRLSSFTMFYSSLLTVANIYSNIPCAFAIYIFIFSGIAFLLLLFFIFFQFIAKWKLTRASDLWRHARKGTIICFEWRIWRWMDGGADWLIVRVDIDWCVAGEETSTIVVCRQCTGSLEHIVARHLILSRVAKGRMQPWASNEQQRGLC